MVSPSMWYEPADKKCHMCQFAADCSNLAVAVKKSVKACVFYAWECNKINFCTGHFEKSNHPGMEISV